MTPEPVEAVALFAFVGTCMGFLLFLYLQLTKKFCFNENQFITQESKVQTTPLIGGRIDDEEGEQDISSNDRKLPISTSTSVSDFSELTPTQPSQKRQSHFSDPEVVESIVSEKTDVKRRSPRTSDLISLAEKGRVGKGNSSGSSETGSSTSSEEEALTQFLLHQKAVERAVRASAELQRLRLLKSASFDGKVRREENFMKSIDDSVKTKSLHPNKILNSRIVSSDRGTGSSEEGGQSSSCDMTCPSRSLSRQTTISSTKGVDGLIREEVHLAQHLLGDSRVTGGTVRGLGIKLGKFEVRYAFDAPTKKLTIRVMKAEEIASRELRGANRVMIKMILLAKKKQKIKTRSKQVVNGAADFSNESYVFNKIPPEDILNSSVRIRLYSTELLKRHHLIGESTLKFSKHKPNQQESRISLVLEPKITRSESTSDVSSLTRSSSNEGSTSSMHNNPQERIASSSSRTYQPTSVGKRFVESCPELLLGLSYNGTTGRLSVSVLKGSSFKSVTMTKAPDTHVKLSLVSSSGQEIARAKTSVRKSQPNPLFKETFVFQVPLFQLPDVTLMVSVFNKQNMKRVRKEMIGWFSLGMNSSGEEELTHWNDMKDNHGLSLACSLGHLGLCVTISQDGWLISISISNHFVYLQNEFHEVELDHQRKVV